MPVPCICLCFSLCLKSNPSFRLKCRYSSVPQNSNLLGFILCLLLQFYIYSGKEPACQCRLGIRDAGLIPGLGRSPGEGNGHPLWYPCLENPMDRGAWQATVLRVSAELDTNEATSHSTYIYIRTHTHTHTHRYMYKILAFFFFF